MEIRYPVHPEQMKTLDTEGLRGHFLIENLFVPDRISLTYSHIDRTIAGGAIPAREMLPLAGARELGSDFFLQRREMGIINIGGPGTVRAAGEEYLLDSKECLYLGRGLDDVSFASASGGVPAKFYFVSAPAHVSHPPVKISLSQANRLEMGDPLSANKRTIYQLIHPDLMKSCQLVMGITSLAPGSVWNTMPSHTHDRRMEVYLYFELPAEAVVFHLMGEPRETRHLVVRNEQAVISPSWSLHGGAGTQSYSFIWGMAGENQLFTDLDGISLSALR